MKKWIFLILFLISLGSLASCSKNEPSLEKEDNKQEEENLPDQTQKPSATGKSIVVYFSATNNTRRVSKIIADYLDSPVFELVPAEPYSSSDLNYNDSNSRVSKEHLDSNRHVELTSYTIENFDSYQYVFIGYPIWWQEACWVLDDFVIKNDFTGKTVIPFATSASSPLGNSAKNLAAKASGGTWLEGIRFSSSANENSIISWVNQLHLS